MGVCNIGIPLPQLRPKEGILQEFCRNIPERIPLFDGIYLFSLFLLLCKGVENKTKGDDDYNNKKDTKESFHLYFLPFG
jgi:hypothetical protein